MSPRSAVTRTGRSPRREFDRLVKEFIDETLRENPVDATNLGIKKWDAEVSDFSASAIRRRESRNKAWLQRFEQISDTGLSGTQKIDRQLLLARLGMSAANADFQNWRRSPEFYVADGTFQLFLHQARPEFQATAAAVKRLAEVPKLVRAAKRNLDPAMASPVVLKRELETVKGQVQFLREELPGFVQNTVLQRKLREAAEPAARAYEQLAAHVEQMIGVATGSFAYGERRYNTLLQTGEMLSYDARSLREMGWREFRSLDKQMSEISRRISGSPNWRKLLPKLQAQHPADMAELVAEYRRLTERARKFVIEKDLMTMPPEEDCRVEPAPMFERGSLTVASYYGPAPFLKGTKGTFNVPVTPDDATAEQIEDRLRGNANYDNPATTVHEAHIGHHDHFRNMAQAGPLRQILTSDYFVEGWAHYVEKMMHEQGFYENDEEVLGYLAARMMRASRIIVDTSLHLGEMTVEDAAKFMRDKAGLPGDVARGEAARYASWPTQASSYLTGAIAIEGMAKRWVAEGKGTLKQFHDAITASGALPLGLAAKAIGLDAAPTIKTRESARLV